MHEELDHHVDHDEAWHRQDEMIHKIIEFGFAAFANAQAGMKDAFVCKHHCLCCIDEGVPMSHFRSAGSGILMEGSDREHFIQQLKQAGVTEVTSHAGCGAAALCREKNCLHDKTVDEVAIEGAKKIAEELGVPYSQHVTDLKRPAHLHDARVVYVDATGVFNPDHTACLPKGFVVSRKYMTLEHALNEVAIAVSIALGDHGFGTKFTKEDPLVVVWVGEKSDEEHACLIEKLTGNACVKLDHWIPVTEQE